MISTEPLRLQDVRCVQKIDTTERTVLPALQYVMFVKKQGHWSIACLSKLSKTNVASIGNTESLIEDNDEIINCSTLAAIKFRNNLQEAHINNAPN